MLGDKGIIIENYNMGLLVTCFIVFLYFIKTHSTVIKSSPPMHQYLRETTKKQMLPGGMYVYAL